MMRRGGFRFWLEQQLRSSPEMIFLVINQFPGPPRRSVRRGQDPCAAPVPADRTRMATTPVPPHAAALGRVRPRSRPRPTGMTCGSVLCCWRRLPTSHFCLLFRKNLKSEMRYWQWTKFVIPQLISLALASLTCLLFLIDPDTIRENLWGQAPSPAVEMLLEETNRTHDLAVLQGVGYLAFFLVVGLLGVLVPLGNLYVVIGMAVYREKARKMMDIQQIYGVSKFWYWTANLAFFYTFSIWGFPLAVGWAVLVPTKILAVGQNAIESLTDLFSLERVMDSPSLVVFQEGDGSVFWGCLYPILASFCPVAAVILLSSTVALEVEEEEAMVSTISTLPILGNLAAIAAIILLDIVFPTPVSFGATIVAAMVDPSSIGAQCPQPESGWNYFFSLLLGTIWPGFALAKILAHGWAWLLVRMWARHSGWWQDGLEGGRLFSGGNVEHCPREGIVHLPAQSRRTLVHTSSRTRTILLFWDKLQNNFLSMLNFVFLDSS